MSEALIKLIREGITAKQAEIEELREKLRELEGQSNGAGKRKRARKETGPTEGSVPFLIKECLKEAGKPLTAAEVSERLKKKDKAVDSRFVAAAVSRYIMQGRIFEQTSDGLYALKRGV